MSKELVGKIVSIAGYHSYHLILDIKENGFKITAIRLWDFDRLLYFSFEDLSNLKIISDRKLYNTFFDCVFDNKFSNHLIDQLREMQ